MKRPAVLSTAPAPTAWPSQPPPTARASAGSAPVSQRVQSVAPLASTTPTGSTYAAAITGSATNRARRNPCSGDFVSPRHVDGVSQPE